MNTLHWFQLNWFDFAIIVVIILSIIVSFFRGFIREAVSLITWLVAILIGLKFATLFGNTLSGHIESATFRYLLGFIILFISVLIIGLLFNLVLKFLIDKSGLSLFDRFFGIFFGAVRGVLLIVIALMFLSVTEYQQATWVKQSMLTPYFHPLVTGLSAFLPKQMKAVSEWVINKPNFSQWNIARK